MSADSICFTVEDDGVGFKAEEGKRGRGLASIKRRAEEIGGTLSIRSDQGTTVRLEVHPRAQQENVGQDTASANLPGL